MQHHKNLNKEYLAGLTNPNLSKREETTAHKKPQTAMPKRDIEERIRCFGEVSLGYTKEKAIVEAKRCLQCKVPKCVEGCPVEIDIPVFVKYIRKSEFKKAIEEVREKNSLPSICGRVCPQETQCMGKCVIGLKGEPINIGALERFVGDKENRRGTIKPEGVPPTGRKVAIVGSGPAGLTAAAEIAKLGHEVTIFEALHVPGGVLMYGIPEFRLPKDIVRGEIRYVESLGVKIETNVIIGKVMKLNELFKMGFGAVFIGSGAGLPTFLQIPGENLNGIYSANEFLIRVNLMAAYKFPEYDTPVKVGKRVVVIGGGNVAIDSSRSALRLGGEVVVVYRRTEEFMPARREEVVNAKEEGIKFVFLATPVRFIGDEKGRVRKVECLGMKLQEPDASGRRKPVPIHGSEFTVDADTVIVAIGQRPNTFATRDEKKIKITPQGTIVVNPETTETNMPGVFAAGDIITGNATVISAMAGGKKAAQTIHKFLMKKAQEDNISQPTS